MPIITSTAFAESENLAILALNQFKDLKKPTLQSDKFTKWTYDIATSTVLYCWFSYKSGAKVPEILNQKPLLNSFSWKLPQNEATENLCKSIGKKGIRPVCTHSTLFAEGIETRKDLPSEYLQVSLNKPFKISGVIYCYLNEDKIAKQTYVGELSFEWVQSPTMKRILLRNGPAELKSGTLLIKSLDALDISGKIYQEPRLAIAID